MRVILGFDVRVIIVIIGSKSHCLPGGRGRGGKKWRTKRGLITGGNSFGNYEQRQMGTIPSSLLPVHPPPFEMILMIVPRIDNGGSLLIGGVLRK